MAGEVVHSPFRSVLYRRFSRIGEGRRHRALKVFTQVLLKPLVKAFSV